MGLNEKISDLVNFIKTTSEYANLKQARNVVNGDKSLKSKIDDLTKKQSALFSSKLSAREIEALSTELNRKYDELRKIPELEKFFNASKQFDNLMAKIYNSISESIQADLKR